MRKVYLEDLPHNENGTIRWRDSIGCSFRFDYDGLQGSIKILEYDNSNYHVKVQYEDRIRSMFVGSIKECKINSLIGLRHDEYKYNIGDILFDSFKVKEHIKMKAVKTNTCLHKGYVLECIKCGYEFNKLESAMDNKGYNKQCPNCGTFHNMVKVGVNDLWTVAPEVAELLLDPEEGYRLTKSTAKRTDWRCKHCKTIIKNRSVNHVYYEGLKCNNCKDGVSYPEKIIRTILAAQGINFEMHKRFSWSGRKEYDFYLIDYNWIIEAHGRQHYDKVYHLNLNTSVEDEQENDRYKQSLAEDNGVDKYIIIDCKESDFNYIFNNVMNSELQCLFTKEMDLDKIKKDSAKNLLIEICEMWDNGNDDIEWMAQYAGVCVHTIMNYLRKGKELGFCSYDGNTKSKKNQIRRTRYIRCITTGENFSSMINAAIYYKTLDTTIRYSCKNNSRHAAGKLPDGTKLYWEYITKEEYDPSKDPTINNDKLPLDN